MELWLILLPPVLTILSGLTARPSSTGSLSVLLGGPPLGWLCSGLSVGMGSVSRKKPQGFACTGVATLGLGEGFGLDAPSTGLAGISATASSFLGDVTLGLLETGTMGASSSARKVCCTGGRWSFGTGGGDW
jgi:hypothetical protein